MAYVSSMENVARYYALCLFAGIRPAEVGRISKDPRAIDLENGVIHVSEASSKTHTSRTIVIQPNLREWLLKFPNGTAYESNYSVRAVRRQFALPKDVLRHTFISNHVTAFGSFAETAIESGNTESIIRKHYYARVSKPDAAKFWQIQ